MLRMRLLLVDDERLALILLEKELRSVAEKSGVPVEIVALQSPGSVMAEAEKWRPDVVFLDIHMPEISGLQIAEMLQERRPEIMVVFMTAFDSYALEAFELSAIDYVLKPLVRDRLEKTFKRIVARREVPDIEELPVQDTKSHVILCSGTLLVQSGIGEPELPKWRTAKAQELFAYLLLRRGATVHKSTILELLFPELGMKPAMARLYTAIYQIRQCMALMGLDITIQNISMQEAYILRVGENVTIENERWEQELLVAAEQEPPLYNRIEELLADYDGGYLRDHDYVWAEGEQARLSGLWMSHARKLAAYLETQGREDEALKLYVRLQEMDPYQESDGLAILKLYERLGQYDKIIGYTTQLENLFMEELGLPLPPSIAAWREERGLRS